MNDTFEKSLAALVGHLVASKSADRANQRSASMQQPPAMAGNALARPMGQAGPVMGQTMGQAGPMSAPGGMPGDLMPPAPQQAPHPLMAMPMERKIQLLAQQAAQEMSSTGRLTPHTQSALQYAHGHPSLGPLLLQALHAMPAAPGSSPPGMPPVMPSGPPEATFSASSGRFHDPQGRFTGGPDRQ